MRRPTASRAALLVAAVVFAGDAWRVRAAPAASAPDAPASGDTLVRQVHAVFRHGARTPVDTYPNDPYLNATLAPVGWGQLTNRGKLQQFEQGEFLRRRYDALLGAEYSPRVLQARSTDKDRTKMSAQLELAGLWPPAHAQRWHPTLRWQPIPVHSVPVSEDHILLGYQPCNRYFLLRDEVLASDEVQSQLQTLNAQELYENLTRITNLTISNPDDVQSLYSTLKAEEGFGLKLPEWTKEYYPKKMELLTALSFVYNVYTKDQQKIKGGPLLKKIMDDSKNKINGTSECKFYMYAGHDSTIVNLLMTLNIWDTQVPEYGILILIELHQEKLSGDYGFKVFLRNSTENEPYPLTIPDCGHYCSFGRFEELVQDKITFNWKELCHVDDPNYVAPSSSPI